MGLIQGQPVRSLYCKLKTQFVSGFFCQNEGTLSAMEPVHGRKLSRNQELLTYPFRHKILQIFMNIPSFEQAEAFIKEAQRLNPGPWVQHSFFVGKAAESIAQHHPRLDSQTAFILGYLHDIGRRSGVADMRHTLDGYHFLAEKGFDYAARICITHVFPLKHINSVAGNGIAQSKN